VFERGPGRAEEGKCSRCLKTISNQKKGAGPVHVGHDKRRFSGIGEKTRGRSEQRGCLAAQWGVRLRLNCAGDQGGEPKSMYQYGKKDRGEEGETIAREGRLNKTSILGGKRGGGHGDRPELGKKKQIDVKKSARSRLGNENEVPGD